MRVAVDCTYSSRFVTRAGYCNLSALHLRLTCHLCLGSATAEEMAMYEKTVLNLTDWALRETVDQTERAPYLQAMNEYLVTVAEFELRRYWVLLQQKKEREENKEGLDQAMTEQEGKGKEKVVDPEPKGAAPSKKKKAKSPKKKPQRHRPIKKKPALKKKKSRKEIEKEKEKGAEDLPPLIMKLFKDSRRSSWKNLLTLSLMVQHFQERTPLPTYLAARFLTQTDATFETPHPCVPPCCERLLY